MENSSETYNVFQNIKQNKLYLIEQLEYWWIIWSFSIIAIHNMHCMDSVSCASKVLHIPKYFGMLLGSLYWSKHILMDSEWSWNNQSKIKPQRQHLDKGKLDRRLMLLRTLNGTLFSAFVIITKLKITIGKTAANIVETLPL